MNETKFKRGDIAKLQGIIGRITFIDNNNGYVRLQHSEEWKAISYVKNLQVPTPEEIEAFQN